MVWCGVRCVCYNIILLSVLFIIVIPNIEKKRTGVFPEGTIERDNRIDARQYFSRNFREASRNYFSSPVG